MSQELAQRYAQSPELLSAIAVLMTDEDQAAAAAEDLERVLAHLGAPVPDGLQIFTEPRPTVDGVPDLHLQGRSRTIELCRTESFYKFGTRIEFRLCWKLHVIW